METLCLWHVLYNDVVQWLDEHLEEACYGLVIGVVARTGWPLCTTIYQLSLWPLSMASQSR